MSKIERQLNLLALLLDTRRPVTVHEIRERLADYGAQGDEAFHRMFERDKADLRSMGYEIEQLDADAWGVDVGYRIAGGEALLEDPGFTPDEIAALSLAAQAWTGASDDGALGVLKLSVGAPGSDPGVGGWVLPRVSMDRDVARVMDAIQRRKRIRFTYRRGGSAEPHERKVEPHRLTYRGAWYLTGFDLGRSAVRHFKLARVQGKIDVPAGQGPDFDPPAESPGIPRGPWEGDPATEAVVAFAPEVAWWAQRRTGAERLREDPEGWVEVRAPVADVNAFAGWVAGFGDQARALSPPELRTAVIAILRAVTERH